MTFTDEQISELARQHYPAHTSPAGEEYHRQCIRAIVETVTESLTKDAARWQFIKRFLLKTEEERPDDDYVQAFVFDESIYFSRRKGETLDDVIDAARQNAAEGGVQ